MRLRPRGVVLVLAAILLLVGALVLLSPPLAVLGAGLSAYYLSEKLRFDARVRRARRGLRATRRLLSPIHHEDRPIDVELRVEGDRAGLLLDVKDRLPPGILATPDEEGEGIRTYRAKRQGLHRFREVEARLRDPGGLFEETLALPAPGSVHVLVGLDRLREARAHARRHRLEAWRADPFGHLLREMQFQGLRLYEEGDRLRDVDWKGTARFDRLMTKTYEKDLERTVLVVLDAGPTMRARRGAGAGKLARAAELGVQLAETAVAQGYRVGVLAVDEARVLHDEPPAATAAHVRRLVERLAGLPPSETVSRRPDVGAFAPRARDDPFFQRLRLLHPAVHAGGAPLRRVVSRLQARHAPGSLLVVALTDLESDPKAMADALLALRRARHAVVCGVLPGSRFLSPGEARLHEAEQAYLELAARRRASRTLAAQGVSVVEMGPRDPVVRLVGGAARAPAGRPSVI